MAHEIASDRAAERQNDEDDENDEDTTNETHA